MEKDNFEKMDCGECTDHINALNKRKVYRAKGIGSDGWYEEAKGWAEGEGILNGTGIKVSPDENCPRAAVATFLYLIYN